MLIFSLEIQKANYRVVNRSGNRVYHDRRRNKKENHMLKLLMGIVLTTVMLASCYAPPRQVRPLPPARVAPAPPPVVQVRPDIPAQIAGQQRRIQQGVAAGQLTRIDAAILQDNLNWIRTEYSRLTAYRPLTPNEARRLEGQLRRNDQMILDRKRFPAVRIY
jgi:hypothetical protein